MKKLFFALFAILALVGCKTNESTPSGSTITGYNEAYLNQTVKATDVTTASKFKFIASESWSTQITDITPMPTEGDGSTTNWVAVNPASGAAGTFEMGITLQPNTDKASRKAAIKITCGASSVTINLTQEGSGDIPSNKKQVKTLILSSIIDGEIAREGTREFTYDNNGRIATIKGTYEGETNDFKLTYSAQTINIEQTRNGTVLNHVATIGDNGFVSKITYDDPDNDNKTYTEELIYEGSYLLSTLKEAIGENFILTWKSGVLGDFQWNNPSGWTKIRASYSGDFSDKINLDLNWMQYGDEGTAMVAGGFEGFHPLMMQGLCGNTNSMFVSKVDFTEYVKSTQKTTSQSNVFEYKFDADMCPTQVDIFVEQTGGKAKVASMEVLYY